MTVRTLLGETEAQFQDALVDAARTLGWAVVHHRPARTRSGTGWATPVAYDGQGWPDLILVRERLIVAELKTDRGRLTAEQTGWIARLETAQVETHVWRPRDWDAALTALRRHDAADG